MGGNDEQYQSERGGNDFRGTDLRVDDTNDNNDSIINDNIVNSNIAGEKIASDWSIDRFDAILRDGGNKKDSSLRIAVYFSREHSTIEQAEFLQKEIGIDGKGFVFGNDRVSVWYDKQGIYLTQENNADVSFSWQVAAERIAELVDNGQYLSAELLDNAVNAEAGELAKRIWIFYNKDLTAHLPEELQAEERGYPGETAYISACLADARSRKYIIDRVKYDVETMANDPENTEWFIQHAHELLSDLEATLAPTLDFPKLSLAPDNFTRFITEREIRTILLKGTGHANGKLDVYDFYTQTHSLTEKAAFLKNSFNYYGASGADMLSFSSEPGKGIKYYRRNDSPDVTLSWREAATRVDALIENGEYLNEREQNDYAELHGGITPTIAEKPQTSMFDAVSLPTVEQQITNIEDENETLEVTALSAELSEDDDTDTELDELIFDISDEDKARLETQFSDAPRSREAVKLAREIYADVDFDAPWHRVMKRLEEVMATEQKSTKLTPYGEYTKAFAENSQRLIFIKIGDFYETYDSGAETAAMELNLSLTTRDGKTMCGIPAHKLDEYSQKMTDSGYNVTAIGNEENGLRSIQTFSPEPKPQQGTFEAADLSLWTRESDMEFEDVVANKMFSAKDKESLSKLLDEGQSNESIADYIWRRFRNKQGVYSYEPVENSNSETSKFQSMVTSQWSGTWRMEANGETTIKSAHSNRTELIKEVAKLCRAWYDNSENGFLSQEFVDLQNELAANRLSDIAAQSQAQTQPEQLTQAELQPQIDVPIAPLETRPVGTNVLMPPVFISGNYNRENKRIRATIEPTIGKYSMYSYTENGDTQLYFLTASGRIDHTSTYFNDIYDEEQHKRVNATPTEAEFDELMPKIARAFEQDMANPEMWAKFQHAAVLNRLDECEAHNVPVRK
ncbi:MAG: hypothetical protein LBN97_05265, partial [Oscillospiraceae bacterium]|nr:hypothetical protein [Oscillospiraceae bacterium]